jgi:predicted Zn-ribbon and HTH transcriptional regulator
MAKSKKKKRARTGRDYNMVGIITGANKAYVEKDQKKEANKKAARTKVDPREVDMVLPPRCAQCGFIYYWSQAKDINEAAAMECGFCSVSCMDYDT